MTFISVFCLALIEPRPTNIIIYEAFNLSEGNCSDIIGEEINNTLYERCYRPLANFNETANVHNYVVTEILSCIGALHSVKYDYCRSYKNDAVLKQLLSQNLKINQLCYGSNTTFTSYVNDVNGFNPWISMLNSVLSNTNNCLELCSVNDRIDPLCLIMMYSKINKTIQLFKTTESNPVAISSKPAHNIEIIPQHSIETSVVSLKQSTKKVSNEGGLTVTDQESMTRKQDIPKPQTKSTVNSKDGDAIPMIETNDATEMTPRRDEAAKEPDDLKTDMDSNKNENRPDEERNYINESGGNVKLIFDNTFVN